MDDDLKNEYAADIQAWIQQSPGRASTDPIAKELIEELTNPLRAGAITVEPTNTIHFSLIERSYPISVNRIDWSKIMNHRVAAFRESHSESVGCDVLRRKLAEVRDTLAAWLQSVGARIDETAVFVGDDTEISLRMTVGVFLDHFPILLEQPEHSYFLALDGRWCLNYTMESDLYLGKSSDALAKGWVDDEIE